MPVKRSFGISATVFAAFGAQLDWAALTAGAASQERSTASCRAQGGGECGVGGDHLLLQLRNGFTANVTKVRRGPGDVQGSGCHGMVDVEKDCGHNGCLVLATEMVGLSCDEYCHRSGRQCLGAWEEQDETCNSKATLHCHETYGTTSDLLCRCSPEVVGLSPSVSGPGHWELVWSDEFDGGDVDRSKWSFVRGGGGFGNQELQHYTDRDDNARVHDGVLSITARCEKYGHDHFTSAKMTTEHLAEWGPGHRIDVRARLPSGEGTWPAIWMLPAENTFGAWPKSGEIDIMEAVGCTPGKIFGTAHTDAYNHRRNSQAYSSKSLSVTEWHTYSVQWEERGLQWFVDGQIYSAFSPSSHSSDKWPFDRRFYLILNLAVGGSWGGSCLDNGWPSCSLGVQFGQPQVMEVDYARVYALRA